MHWCEARSRGETAPRGSPPRIFAPPGIASASFVKLGECRPGKLAMIGRRTAQRHAVEEGQDRRLVVHHEQFVDAGMVVEKFIRRRDGILAEFFLRDGENFRARRERLGHFAFRVAGLHHAAREQPEQLALLVHDGEGAERKPLLLDARELADGADVPEPDQDHEQGREHGRAVERVLDVLDDAVALVVHHHKAHVRFFLHRRPQLAEVQRKTTVAAQRHHLAIRRTERRANRKRHAGTDGSAHGINAVAGAVHREYAIGPGGLVKADVAHPQRFARHGGTHDFGKILIEAKRVAIAGDSLRLQAFDSGHKARIGAPAALQSISKRV